MSDGIDLVGLVDRVVNRVHDLLRIPTVDPRVLATVAVVLLGLVILREVAILHALAPHRRVRYRLRSTGATERTMEEMERWAAQLSRVRRRVRRFADRPAQAVRIRLESTPQGPVYTMEGSRRLAQPILRDPALAGVAITRLRPRDRRRSRRRRTSGAATMRRRP